MSSAPATAAAAGELSLPAGVISCEGADRSEEAERQQQPRNRREEDRGAEEEGESEEGEEEKVGEEGESEGEEDKCKQEESEGESEEEEKGESEEKEKGEEEEEEGEGEGEEEEEGKEEGQGEYAVEEIVGHGFAEDNDEQVPPTPYTRNKPMRAGATCGSDARHLLPDCGRVAVPLQSHTVPTATYCSPRPGHDRHHHRHDNWSPYHQHHHQHCVAVTATLSNQPTTSAINADIPPILPIFLIVPGVDAKCNALIFCCPAMQLAAGTVSREMAPLRLRLQHVGAPGAPDKLPVVG